MQYHPLFHVNKLCFCAACRRLEIALVRPTFIYKTKLHHSGIYQQHAPVHTRQCCVTQENNNRNHNT